MQSLSTRFQVFVPGYNCQEYLDRCLRSIEEQGYPNVDILMIDDASTDFTGDMMDGWAARLDPKFTSAKVIHNETNQKMPWNLWRYAREGDPQDVIFIVDADDYLPHGDVLDRVAEHFSDPDLWMTYGSYTRFPDPNYMPNPAEDYPPDVKANRSYRAYRKPCFNHPLVFRRHLWNKVPESDLQFDDGTWFRGGYDYLIMMPMLEMAGNRWKFLPEILYVYNEENPISDARVNQWACEYPHQVVMQRPVRDALD